MDRSAWWPDREELRDRECDEVMEALRLDSVAAERAAERMDVPPAGAVLTEEAWQAYLADARVGGVRPWPECEPARRVPPRPAQVRRQRELVRAAERLTPMPWRRRALLTAVALFLLLGLLGGLERAGAAPVWSQGVASWYWDPGVSASGRHPHYGVAHKSMRFGTRVRFCFRGRCVTATVHERGPFVAGRMWDLNQNVRRALRFEGVGVVKYRVVR